MNKKELIKAAALKAEVTQKSMEETLDVLLETITETLAVGEDVKLAGFGKFEVTEKPEKVQNSFGKEVVVPAHNVVKFKPAQALKDALN